MTTLLADKIKNNRTQIIRTLIHSRVSGQTYIVTPQKPRIYIYHKNKTKKATNQNREVTNQKKNNQIPSKQTQRHFDQQFHPQILNNIHI